MKSGNATQDYSLPPSPQAASTGQQLRKRHVKSAFLRWLLFCCGWISVAAGIIGIFLPLVPTVPFLLLAVACFARSSDRFHSWLVGHSHMGPLLRDYLNGAGMPLRAKRIAIGMIWVSFPATIFIFAQVLWLKILLLILASAITIYLLSLPTGPESTGKSAIAP